ncbi:MAG TPA: ABC transporter permease [Albitalea sp.]|nr:ABC transporter permease [Albitalea sp.]
MNRISAARRALTVYRKEIVDALRDRRTLMVVFLSSVMLGPLVLIALSGFIASLEEHADKREVVVLGMENAPSLRNYFERQSYVVKVAPRDYEVRLRASKLGDPVVIVPPDFDAAVLRGDMPVLEVVSDSSNKRSEGGAARVQHLLQGFVRERATLQLAMRGVSPELLEPAQIEERDLASAQTRGTQITGMLPFFVMMAVLYGALNAALDTTAGERERGSLEPLLMVPAERVALVLGKWGAVASLSMLIAVLSCFSFVPAQWLLRSDTLQAMFQFGWREALLFLAVLLPFAAALSAVLMAVAIRCKTFKEAQANSTVLVLGVSLLPLVTVFNQSGESPWQLWVPALAQNTLMTRVLRGESLNLEQMLVPLLVCALLTVLGVWLVARMLRTAAVR